MADVLCLVTGLASDRTSLPDPQNLPCLGELFAELVCLGLTGAGGRAAVRFLHGSKWITFHGVLEIKLRSDRESVPVDSMAF